MITNIRRYAHFHSPQNVDDISKMNCIYLKRFKFEPGEHKEDSLCIAKRICCWTRLLHFLSGNSFGSFFLLCPVLCHPAYNST